MKIGVSGANGFVGGATVPFLVAAGHQVTRIARDLGTDLGGLDAIVHLAGLAHRQGRQTPSEAEFEAANHVMTVELARKAREAGVKRFVFISSIAVVAGNDGVLSPRMPHNPIGAYGASKARAEIALRAMDGLQNVILRPPLVYGPRPRGNMASLLRLALSPLPLPFASVRNRRTLVSVTNLASAIEFACVTAGLEGRVFHATDAREVSLCEIMTRIREGAGLPRRLLAVPPKAMQAVLKLAGKGKVADQLFGDLVVDGGELRAAGWRAPLDPAEALTRMGGAERRISA
jgi:UDP-glucose 4-epimerase